jgi:hypothetical protein
MMMRNADAFLSMRYLGALAAVILEGDGNVQVVEGKKVLPNHFKIGANLKFIRVACFGEEYMSICGNSQGHCWPHASPQFN